MNKKKYPHKNFMFWYCRFLAILPLFFSTELFDAYELPKKSVFYAICLFPLLLSFPQIISQKITLREKLAGLFILTCLFSFIKAENTFLFFNRILLFSAVFITAFSITRIITFKEYLIATATTHFSVSVIISIYGIIQNYGLLIIEQDLKNGATFGNPNVSAYYFVILMPLFWKMFMSSSGVKKILQFSGLLMIFGYMYIINSRAANVIIILQICSMICELFFKKYRKYICIAAISMIFLVGTAYFSYHDISDLKKIDVFRYYCWSSTINLITDNFWTGVGLGNFEIQYPLYRNTSEINYIRRSSMVLMPHNDYLHIFSEAGVLACIFFVLIIFISIFIYNRTTEYFLLRDSVASAALIMITGWTTIMAIPLFLTVLFLFWRDGELISKNNSQNHIVFRIIIGISVCALCRYIFFNLNADLQYMRALNSSQMRRYDEALDDIKLAIAYIPKKYEYHFQIANIYRNRGAHKKAIDHYKYSLKLNQTYAYSYLSLGFCYKKIENMEIAEKYFLRALEIMPNLDVALLNLSMIYEAQKKNKSALKYMKMIDLQQMHTDRRKDLYLERIEFLEKKLNKN